MKNSDFIKECVKRENKDFKNIRSRLTKKDTIRLLHSGMGAVTEAGELMDALKKYIIYGKELDVINIKEELGDLFFYISMICDELNVSFEEIMKMNVEKLTERYGPAFSEKDAINRDLKKEREILEQNENFKPPEERDHDVCDVKGCFSKPIGISTQPDDCGTKGKIIYVCHEHFAEGVAQKDDS